MSAVFGSQAFGFFLNPGESDCLGRYAARVKATAIEIGCLNGGSTCFISKAMPKGTKLFSIDPFVPDSMLNTLQGSIVVAYVNVLRHGNLRRVKFLKDYSYNVAARWSRPVDLLWIDGSHEYGHVRQDFELWSPFLTSGGHVLFHDSNQKHPNDSAYDGGWIGPTRVCNEIKQDLADRYEHVESLQSINAFCKR